MTNISKQLGKNFIFISMISIAFITIVTNISINLFFSNYVKSIRNKDDIKIVQYIESIYANNNGLDSQSLMNIMHYALSESVIVRLRNMQNETIWESGTLDSMHDMMKGNSENIENQIFSTYPLNFKENQVGIIDIGRSKSIISSLEDKRFLSTINISFAGAFIFSIVISILLSIKVSKKFLNPIYLIKENAQLIKNAKYKMLHSVNTNTFELHDLSVTVKELAEKLESQDELRKRLTSDISHELRTPLATLQSHIEAFMDGVWEPNPEKLSIVLDEITRLTKLIKDLSDLSILESYEINLNKHEIDLSKLLENIIESFEPLLMNKNISLFKEIQSEIKLSGDEDRLRQIFINIFSNAYKYTNENGSLEVKVTKKENIKVVFEDTGIGISNKDLKHIFERFYRSDISRNRGTGGTGIGLTITKALVEAHNGKITIESEEGKGTRVIIEFS